MIGAIDQVVNNDYAIYNGDSCELIKNIPDNSIHFGIHSPPFEGLYKFSNSDRDISNNDGPQFWEHYGFLIREIIRITMPGRLHSVHVMQLPTSKGRDGFIGMRDFRGETIRAYQDAGWLFHSEVCIWKDPVVAQQRTKSIRLLHKQIVKDSTVSGMGLADYVVTFRKPGDNAIPVAGCLNQYLGDMEVPSTPDGRGPDDRPSWFELAARIVGTFLKKENEPSRSKWTHDMDGRNWYSIETWQRYASPVWTDIRQNRTLQYRGGRDEQDEVHISPLQLDVIERCIQLWSNPGEKVFTPFLGIGSEVWGAVELGRKGIGFELKPSYFAQAVKNLESMNKPQHDIFSV